MAYTNSSLLTYQKISPNKTSPRNHAIDRLTVHCFVGQITAKRGCEVFQNKSRNASCNYVIGKDGDIGLCVEEKDRSWCSSNRDNDMRAITFEVASDSKHPYAVTDAALNSLIDLITDICKRNGKKKVLWFADKNKTLAYNPKSDEMVMTVHRWFAAKACPGDYLYEKHAYIAEEVNKRLDTSSSSISSPTISQFQNELYRIRKDWNNASSQIGAYSSLDRAKKAWKAGYYVFDSKGNVVYPIPSGSSTSVSTNQNTYQVKLLDDLNIRKNPNGQIVQVNGARKGFIYTIVETQGTWGRLKSGAGWISVSDKYVKRV